MPISKIISVFVFCFISTIAFAAETKELSVSRIMPAGDDVAQTSQIVIEFNRPVVPLGRMERSSSEIPVNFQPKINCQWRWLTQNTLACQLDAKDRLQQATRYQVTVNPGIKAEDGATLTKSYTHEFTTTLPNLSYAAIKTWLKPNLPILRVVFNQPVREDSIANHLYFKVNDKRIASRIFHEKLSTLPTIENEIANKNQVWLIVPAQQLPLNAEISLELEPGLQSQLGTEPGKEASSSSFSFTTFPKFKLLGLRCFGNDGKEIILKPDEKITEDKTKHCNPLAPVSLLFNSPVQQNKLRKYVSYKPALSLPKVQDKYLDTRDFILEGLEHHSDKIYAYSVYSQEGFAAAEHYTLEVKGADLPDDWWSRLVASFKTKPKPKQELSDVFGRHLRALAKFEFQTDHRSPNYVLPYTDAVLEKTVKSDVPFYVTNLDTLHLTYKVLNATGLKPEHQKSITVPKIKDIQFAIPLEIRSLLNHQSGVAQLQLTTDPMVNSYPATLYAQVTPFQLQAKIGHFNSLVWVTDLATGQSVKDAKITWYQSVNSTLAEPEEIIATATTDAAGLAILPGTETVKAAEDDSSGWFISATKNDDMAWMSLNYTYKMSNYALSDFYSWRRAKYDHIVIWGTTAQGIYRPGDTLQYKIFVRNQNNHTLVPAPNEPYQLVVTDPTGKKVYEQKDLKLDDFGTLHGEFTLSKEAVAGWYQFELKASFADDQVKKIGTDDESEDSRNHHWQAMRVLVSDFTPASFKVTNQINGQRFTADQSVEVVTQAKLHGGGTYTNANFRIAATLQQREFTSKASIAKDYIFNQPDTNRDDQPIFQQAGKLDAKGESTIQFTIPEQKIIYGKLFVESAVQDERGKYVSAQTKADYLGVDRLVGLKLDGWLYKEKQPGKVHYLVVDEQSQPAAGTLVNLVIQRQVTKGARVKSEGNAYLMNYTTRWEDESKCQGTASTEPLDCEFTPQHAGTYRITASLADTKGRTYTNQLEFWVVGAEYVLWNQEEESALPIVPERNDYKVGDKARFLVKNPYPEANALITIERYGVIEHWVQKLSGNTPVIEVPIKPDYLPGFYLSVTVFSPRVVNSLTEPAPKVGQLDLGKPSMKMGYTRVIVDDPYKELTVSAKTDKTTYKPGEQVQVQLHAEPRVVSKQINSIQFTVAVVDEAVLDLLSNSKQNYDIYHGLYQLDNLDVDNYSLISRLIGRQKFEKKGANPGGDGGSSFAMRSLFKYVSYWNPSVTADAQGNAKVTLTVPDNLTQWRVIVLAATPSDQLGVGQANFVVNRPTEIRPVLPNQVTDGDSFNAGFNIMNRTNQARDIMVTIEAALTTNNKPHTEQHQETIKLMPYQRKVVLMPIQTRHGNEALITPSTIHFKVTAGDKIDKDGLLYDLTVNPRQKAETIASYGSSTETSIKEMITVPTDTLPNSASIQLALSPTVIGNIDGAFKYGKYYPYTCWEQRLTKGLLAAYYIALKHYLAPNLSWPEADKLPSEILQKAVDFQAPNGGMAYFTPQDSHVDPYLSAYTALAFNWFKQLGYKIPELVERNLHNYLKAFLKQNNAPEFYSDSMLATTRAVALAALAEHNSITASDLERLRGFLPQMSLLGQAYYLQAALEVPESKALANTIWQQIMSHADQTAGKLTFTQTLDDGYLRILTSPARDNCAVLSALLSYQQKTEKGKTLQDLPFKMVRAITLIRGSRDHWQNTQENLFCSNALINYSRNYEKVVPSMQLRAAINGKQVGTATFKDINAAGMSLMHHIPAQIQRQPLDISLTKQGQGRYYYATRLNYIPQIIKNNDVNAGIELHREYSVERNGRWVLLKDINNKIKQGELIKIDLFLNLPAARNFVVVDDPVPGGLEPVNPELATSSQFDAAKAVSDRAGGSWWFNYNDWHDFGFSRWSFYHQEFHHQAVRFYADYLEPGRYHLSYVAQAISAGNFTVQPSLAQEMYDPDVFGQAAGWQLKISQE